MRANRSVAPKPDFHWNLKEKGIEKHPVWRDIEERHERRAGEAAGNSEAQCIRHIHEHSEFRGNEASVTRSSSVKMGCRRRNCRSCPPAAAAAGFHHHPKTAAAVQNAADHSHCLTDHHGNPAFAFRWQRSLCCNA